MHRTLALFFILLLPLWVAAETDADPVAALLAEGNAAMAREAYPEAIDAYSGALNLGESANLHYNLGTAYARTEDWGRATLHLLKALALDPNHTDARTNLALVRTRAGKDLLNPSKLESAASLFPLNTWVLLATVAFWVLVFLLILGRGDRSTFTTLLKMSAAIVGLLSGSALVVYHLGSDRGVVLDDSTLRVAPTAESPLGPSVEAGTVARLQRAVNGFLLLRTETGVEGYLPPDGFATVWER